MLSPTGVLAERDTSAVVYDMSPWTHGARSRLAALTRSIPPRPILLYLPPEGRAFTSFAGLPHLGEVRVQIQARDGDSLRHLRMAMGQLVGAVPRVRIMDGVRQAVPGLSSTAYLLGHRALAILAAGKRPRVAAIGRALGVSERTLQRRLQDDGLPSPKAFVDWLTLAHIEWTSASRDASQARTALGLGLNPNDLYRLRKRVRGRSVDLGADPLSAPWNGRQFGCPSGTPTASPPLIAP